jgi:anti-sigma factor RsiW
MCPKDELISAYLDGEIEQPWSQRLAAHLHACERCRRRLESMQAVSLRLQRESIPGIAEEEMLVRRRVIAALAGRRAGDADSYFRVERQIRSDRNVPFWRRQVLLPMPMLAAGIGALFILVASLFFFVGRSGNELQQARNELEKLKTVHVYYPVQNPVELMKAISDENPGEDVIIRLPEDDTFRVIGEPRVVYIKNGGN